MDSKKIGKVARITAAVYVFAIGLFILVNQLVSLITPHQSEDKLTDLLQTMTTTTAGIMAFLWSGLWICASYAIFKDKKDNFPAILTLLMLVGIGGVGINYMTAKYQVPSSFNYNPFIILLFYLIPAILIIISWKTEPKKAESSIERARRILGEHVHHLSDEELHHTLTSTKKG